MINVTLFDDLILVRPLPMEKVSEGGIIIPDTADKLNKKATGIVVEHGEGFMDINTGIRQPIAVQKDDKVSFTFGLGTPMNIEGEDLLLLRERDLDFIFSKELDAEDIKEFASKLKLKTLGLCSPTAMDKLKKIVSQ